jgi:hypothetical protein
MPRPRKNQPKPATQQETVSPPLDIHPSASAVEARGRYRLSSGAIVELDLVVMPAAQWENDFRSRKKNWMVIRFGDHVAAAELCG